MNDPKTNKNMVFHSNEVRFTSESGCLSLNIWKYKELKENIDNYLDLLECVPETISTLDIKEFFQSDFLRDPSFSNFHSLDDKTRTIISMIHISASYIRYLAYYDINKLTELKKEFTEDIADDDFFNFIIKDDNSIKLYYSLRDSRHEIIKTENLNLTLRHIKIVFSHIVSIKNCFLLLLELFYKIIGSVKHLHFDDKTFKQLNDSIIKEDFEVFRTIIDSWNHDIVNELANIVETFYPTLLFVESITPPRTLYNISDDLGANVDSNKYEFSFVGVVIIILINYILNQNVANHLDHIEIGELVQSYKHSYSFPEKQFASNDPGDTCGIVNPIDWDYYMNWINNGAGAIIDLFSSNQKSLLIDEYNTETELESIENEKQGEQMPKVLIDPILPEPEEKPKRHLSVGHSEKTIKQLATYLVTGYTNKRGSIPPLVSSSDEKDITINKLVFLFTGNKDYSFDGQYNLTWNAEQVYLKLLIKLLYNLNELATGSHAVDEGRANYISNKYIKCRLTGGVWPKVAEAFENIKSGATIRNADYKKNYKDTEAPINKKRLRDMKVIADLWLKCKDDIDFYDE